MDALETPDSPAHQRAIEEIQYNPNLPALLGFQIPDEAAIKYGLKPKPATTVTGAPVPYRSPGVPNPIASGQTAALQRHRRNRSQTSSLFTRHLIPRLRLMTA